MLLDASSWSVCSEFKFEILLCTNPMLPEGACKVMVT